MAESRRQPRHTMESTIDEKAQQRRDLIFIGAFIAGAIAIVAAMFLLAGFLSESGEKPTAALVVFIVFAVLAAAAATVHTILGRRA